MKTIAKVMVTVFLFASTATNAQFLDQFKQGSVKPGKKLSKTNVPPAFAVLALPRGQGSNGGIADSNIYLIDLLSGEIYDSAPLTLPLTLNESRILGFNGMAYNPVDGKYYAIARLGTVSVPAKISGQGKISAGGGVRKLVTLNLNDLLGIDSVFFDLPSNSSGLAITNEGTIYIVTGSNELYEFDGESWILKMGLTTSNGGSTIMYDSENDVLYHFSGYIESAAAKPGRNLSKASEVPFLNSNMVMERVNVIDSSTTPISMFGDNMDEVFAGVYVPGEGFAVSSFDSSFYGIVTDGTVIHLAGPFDRLYRGFSLIHESLPVELVAFDYTVKNSNIILNWNTKSETNNYGWEIEYRQLTTDNGQQKNTEFRKVGFVAGSGTSTESKSYQFTFESQLANFEVRLKQLDSDGSVHYSKILKIENRPNQFVVFNNYPNPFNPITQIVFNLPNDANVNITVFNLLGQEIAVLVNGNVKSGNNIKVPFNASGLTSGMYFYRVTANGKSITKSMTLMK